MRKRVKVSIQKLIKEVLDKDLEYFGVKMERICNLIIQGMGYDKTLRVHDRMKNEKKVVIHFNLNDRNTKFFEDMMKQSGEEVEVEFFRRVLSTYTNFHPSIRESILYRSKFSELEYAIKSKSQIKIAVDKKVLDVVPVGLVRDEETGYSLIEAKHQDTVHFHRVKEIDILKIF